MVEHLIDKIPSVLWIEGQDNQDCHRKYKKGYNEGSVPSTHGELKLTVYVVEHHTLGFLFPVMLVHLLVIILSIQC